jgi:RNA 2',3'-cyclic 3'-phosphodiesterase
VTETRNETWRVFCAIELPSLVREKISEHIQRLRAAAPDSSASWVRPENVHLTLKFVGEIPVDRVKDLTQAAANAAAGLSQFEIVIGNTGSFPKHGTPRVLWLGIDDFSGKLARLQTTLDDECLQLGFAKEARVFNPHLTIARGRKPKGARALALAHEEIGFVPTDVSVRELNVIRSELSSTGSNYTAISQHVLANNHGPHIEKLG